MSEITDILDDWANDRMRPDNAHWPNPRIIRGSTTSKYLLQAKAEIERLAGEAQALDKAGTDALELMELAEQRANRLQAENEGLRTALEEIADEQKVYLGHGE